MEPITQTLTADPLAFHTGDRLRKAREHTGMDRKTFAGALGCARDTVTAYEQWTDLKAPRESTLRQWSMATGVSLHWLKTGEYLPGEGPLAQSVELRTFNPKSAGHLKLVSSNPSPELAIERSSSPVRLIGT